jgi:pimeloyl-ACP methyl ester carboxylesterase
MVSIEPGFVEQSLAPAIPAPKPKPLRRTLMRIALSVVGVVALAGVAGAAYEQVAGLGDAAAYPAAGRMVDVGGYRLHLDCRGSGSPTVVMDAGLGASSLDWTLVQPDVARTTQVCTYDRAGMGWSEPGPGLRSPARLAEELHTLLHNGGVQGPYVLVGHSLAGETIRLFASAHPAEVAGMLLVDARSERLDAGADMEGFAAALRAQAAEYSVARRLGIVRLLGGKLIDLPLVPPALATAMALFATNPAAVAETTWEGLGRADDDQALASTTLGAIPLIVIAAGDNMRNQPDWAVAQRAMAKLSTRGRLVVAEGSGHAVQLEAPDLVIDAIGDLLAEVRRDK